MSDTQHEGPWEGVEVPPGRLGIWKGILWGSWWSVDASSRELTPNAPALLQIRNATVKEKTVRDPH